MKNNMAYLTEQEQKDLYYKLERKNGELELALKNAIEEPGISLQSISNIIKRIFKAEEVIKLKELL
jgi:hypothetical protein